MIVYRPDIQSQCNRDRCLCKMFWSRRCWLPSSSRDRLLAEDRCSFHRFAIPQSTTLTQNTFVSWKLRCYRFWVSAWKALPIENQSSRNLLKPLCNSSDLPPVACRGSWMPGANEVLGCPQIKIFGCDLRKYFYIRVKKILRTCFTHLPKSCI